MASVSACFEIEQYGLNKYSQENQSVRDTRFSKVLREIKSVPPLIH